MPETSGQNLEAINGICHLRRGIAGSCRRGETTSIRGRDMAHYQALLGAAALAGWSLMLGPSGVKAEEAPAEASSFDEVLSALLGGNDVTVTVDLAQCTGGNPASPGMRIEGGFHIRSFIVPD